MGKNFILLCPTVNNATFEWKKFLREYPTIINKANKASLTIELLNGNTLIFRGETQGQLALKGFHEECIIRCPQWSYKESEE